MNNLKIKLTYSGVQNVYHDHFKPYLCTSDIDLPKMYNQGWNSFRFIGGEPEFSGENIPTVLKSETETFVNYESEIEVFRKDGTKCSGYYYKTLNKKTGLVKETFCFD